MAVIVVKNSVAIFAHDRLCSPQERFQELAKAKPENSQEGVPSSTRPDQQSTQVVSVGLRVALNECTPHATSTPQTNSSNKSSKTQKDTSLLDMALEEMMYKS